MPADITLRDYAAVQVLAALMSSDSYRSGRRAEEIAGSVYGLVDAMLVARERR